MKLTKRNFASWNEKMFIKYNNERLYLHANSIISLIENKRVKTITKILDGQNGQKILSAGCGEGYLINKIKSGDVYAVDLSKEALRRAKKKVRRNGKTVFLHADVQELPFADNFFDKVECSEVIEHVLEPSKLVAELGRVLKPNGLCVFSFPNENLINRLKQYLIKLGMFDLFFKDIPKDMSSEWHLRAMSLALFDKYIHKQMLMQAIIRVPLVVIPLRYIAVCQNNKK